MPVPNTNTYERVSDGVLRIGTNRGDFFLIDADDEAIAKRHCWSRHVHGYARAVTRVGGRLKTVYLHRLVCRTTEERPHVDHINGDAADCRKANLRACTRSQNLSNQKRRSDNTSGFKGVGLHSQTGMYRARIRSKGIEKHLGLFESPQVAAVAAEAAREILHKEFARHA
jgi:hypothetical protein